jgi:hypothetical protein
MTPDAAMLAVFDHTQSIAAADVDGDGDLDLLLGNSGNPSQVLLNAGDGTFQRSNVLPGGSVGTRSIAAADVDGDGDLDVLLGNDGTPSRVLLNAGSSSPRSSSNTWPAARSPLSFSTLLRRQSGMSFQPPNS